MHDRVLFVDDEPNVLETFKRLFRKDFPTDTAVGGAAGLEMIRSKGPYAVICSDQHMPEIDGTQFLSEARKLNPHSVRVMLTGNADFITAMKAVNEGRIFRFLVKPIEYETLCLTIKGCIAQHKLIVAEKEVLEKTLYGSIEMMSELLSLVNPLAFSQTVRIRRCIKMMAERLGLAEVWQFDMAALLSQIGCVTIPSETLRKIHRGDPLLPEERDKYRAHPEVAAHLLEKIPRLETVAEIVRGQQRSFVGDINKLEVTNENRAEIGGHLLRIAISFDQRLMRGMSVKEAIEDMTSDKASYFPPFVSLLHEMEEELWEAELREFGMEELRAGQVLGEDIFTSSGILLATSGTELSETMLMRLRAFALANELKQTACLIREKVRQGLPKEAVTETP